MALTDKFFKVKYTWNRVSSYYVLCLVTSTKYGKLHKSYKSRWYQSSSKSKFLYHNLEDYKLCRHMNLLATIGKSYVFSLKHIFCLFGN